jgi:hypothetical protein
MAFMIKIKAMPPMHMTNNTSGVISFVACIAYRVSWRTCREKAIRV